MAMVARWAGLVGVVMEDQDERSFWRTCRLQATGMMFVDGLVKGRPDEQQNKEPSVMQCDKDSV